MIEIKTTSTDILFDDDICDFRNITTPANNIKKQPETKKIEPSKPEEYKHIGKIYTDYSGKILCVTNYTRTLNDKMKMHITAMSLKNGRSSDYIVPTISELFPKYNPKAHYERLNGKMPFYNPTIIGRQYELAELLKIDGAKNPAEIKSGAVSVRLLDRLAELMELDELNVYGIGELVESFLKRRSVIENVC